MCEIVFHGTNHSSKEKILVENFKQSEAKNDWLGTGVYFFADGIGCPIEHSNNWCLYQKKFPPNQISVLQVKLDINQDHFLDATTYDGMEEFNKIRVELLNKHNKFFPKDRAFGEDNCKIWNIISELLDLHIVVNNLYICKISNNKRERDVELKSNVPNSTVLCVKKDGIINTQDISLVDK